MASLVESIVDFVRERHLNFMLVGVLTVVYLMYHYSGLLMKTSHGALDDEYDRSRSSSRTRTRSPGDYKSDSKYGGRKGRKTHRRCHECEYDE